MRIMHLVTGPTIGGAERLIGWMVNRPFDPGHEHVVCTLRDRGPLHREVEEAGGTAFSLGMRSGADIPKAVLGLRGLLRRHPVDVLHTHLYHPGVMVWALSRFQKVPAWVHTRHYEQYLHQFGKPGQVLLDRWASRSADHVAAISESSREVLVRREGVPAERVSVIHNGIEVPPSRRVSPPKRGAANLVAVGSLHARKGHSHLIRALPAVRDAFPGATLTILGEGEERDGLERLVTSLGLGGVVRMPGYVTEVPRAVAEGDLMVHPSVEEGFGIAILEGMAQECAVVASRVGGIPEVVDDGVTGLLVPPADPAALAGAVIGLLNDPERCHSMGAAGRRRVERDFTIDAMIGKYAALYKRVLSAGGTRSDGGPRPRRLVATSRG